jgi:hypothetical protein
MSKLLISNKTLAQAKRLHEQAMDFKCDITRPVSSGVDAINQPLPAHYQSHLPDVPCLYIQNVSTGTVTGEQIENWSAFALTKYQIFIPIGTDVEITDRVEAIRNRESNPVDDAVKYYEIKEKNLLPTALQLSLQAIQ